MNGLLSDNVAIVTVRGVQGRSMRGPDIYCHLVTGRRPEKEVISKKQLKRWGQMAAREKKNASGRERKRESKKEKEDCEQRDKTGEKEVGK